MDVRELQELRAEVERASKAADRLRGANDEVLRQLKEEFGCDTLAQAERLLAKTTKERDRAVEAARDAVDNYRREYGGRDGGDDRRAAG